MSVARFKTPSKPPANRGEAYRLAVALSTEVGAIVTHVASPERFFLRDQLDRKSTTLPQLIDEALRAGSLVERRAVYVSARRVTQDCLAVLDALGQRGAVEPSALTAAQAAARALIDALGPLTVPPAAI